MDNRPLVSIIVTTLDTPKITRACLESVIRNTAASYELIVVNNSRGKGIRNCLRNFRDIKIIQNKKNLGYTKAANQGALQAAGKFLCFLNSDTVVPPGWLDRLLKPALLPGVGAVGAERWGQPPSLNKEARRVLTSLTDEALQKWHRKGARSVSFLCGYCLLIPRAVMASVGLFDERFFFGWEDSDYSLRLRLKGYKLMLVEALFVSHIGGASTSLKRHRKLAQQSKTAFLSKWSRLYKTHFHSKEAVFSYVAQKIPVPAGKTSPLKAFNVSFLGSDKKLKTKNARTKNTKVIVSVMMIAHNAEAWISEAIESVLAQTFREFELIVLDDGSTDRTARIAMRYKKHPQFRFYKNERQMGIPASRNRVLKLARGRYIAVCDADDMLRPSFLEHFTNFMEKNPKTGWVYGNRLLIDGEGFILGRSQALPMNGKIEYQRNVMQHAGALIRKSLILKAGGYDETLQSCEDYDLAFQIAAHSKITCLSGEPLYLYRRHADSISRINPWATQETDLLRRRAKSFLRNHAVRNDDSHEN